jgi:hypothetical protein
MLHIKRSNKYLEISGLGLALFNRWVISLTPKSIYINFTQIFITVRKLWDRYTQEYIFFYIIN